MLSKRVILSRMQTIGRIMFPVG